MKITTLTVALATAAAVAGGAYLAFSPGRTAAHASAPAPAAAPSADPGDARALEREIGSLRRDLESLRKKEGPRAAATSAAPAPEDEPGVAREASHEDPRQAAEEQHRKAITQLDRDLRKTARDAEWTAQIEREVSASLPAGSGSAVESVDCHSSLCKVSLAHEDREALDRFRNDLSAGLRYDMDMLVSPNGDAFRTQIFLSRQVGGMPDWRHEMADEGQAL